MKTVQIPKKSGGTRTICVPSAKRKRRLRQLLPKLHRLVRRVCDLSVVHGFAELRSAVTNAACHVGYRYTLTFDLADFFDTVSQTRHETLLHQALPLRKDRRAVWHDGVARQGLPTSPLVANLAAAEMDQMLKHPFVTGRHTYTRYADDLSFSTDSLEVIAALKIHVPRTVEQYGFRLNPKKTRLQDSARGRRIICGIGVDDEGIHPTRATKRKLRAAIHNAKTGKVKHFPRRQWTRYTKWCRHRGYRRMPKAAWLQRWLNSRVRGLEEWASLKPPSVGRRTAQRIAESHHDSVDTLRELAERR